MNYIFKVISDPTRRAILDLLKDGDMNAGEFAAKFNISKPSISHHLDILKRADLVSATKKGQHMIYSLNTTVIEDLFQWIYNLKGNLNEKKTTPGNPLMGPDYTPDTLSD